MTLPLGCNSVIINLKDHRKTYTETTFYKKTPRLYKLGRTFLGYKNYELDLEKKKKKNIIQKNYIKNSCNNCSKIIYSKVNQIFCDLDCETNYKFKEIEKNTYD